MKAWTCVSAAFVTTTAVLLGTAATAGVLGEAQHVPPQTPHLQSEPFRALLAPHSFHAPAGKPGDRDLPAGPAARAPRTDQPTKWPPAEPRLFGYPTHTDPLFDTGTRPNWEWQHLERPAYERPTYDEPDYTPPLLGLDPVRKPVYDRPLYIMPTDNKPNNNMKFYEAPGCVAPTMPSPFAHGPNYVIDPNYAPAIVYPAYPDPYDAGPEYLKPTYVPQEYQPPRYLPTPYIAPPK